MPPVVIDIRSADDSRDVVHRAVQALAEGKLVALPTETVYGLAASALNADAVGKLVKLKERAAGKALTLAIRSSDDVLDYLPTLSPLGRRLARRCWPGPVTIVGENRHPESLAQQLPPSVKEAVAPHGTLGLRVPAHPLVLEILKLLVGPIVLTSANLKGQADPVTADQVMEGLGDQVDLLLNDGPSRLGQASTVVKVCDKKLEVLRAGVVSEQTLKRLSSLMILLVCTGNTCRSPMAEVMCRKLIADKLGCTDAELGDHGVLVMSAGLSAMMGARPTAEAVDVMRKMGLNLADHESQPLTTHLVRHADIIWTMTRSHRQAIVTQWPEAASRTILLATDQSDVADPIGGPLEYYQQCAEQIKMHLAERVRNLDI
jgi:tRNA threonylcarbamoyl adenosine modification protein (Sua5/YciO/YrdC/YwlC family)